MIPLGLEELARVVGGELVGDGSVLVTGPAFVDSRHPEPGGLFVAVVGEQVDGHDFAAAAVAGGAAAVLGSRPTAVPTVVVPDPVAALGTLARWVLEQCPEVTVVALTGSQGKTGTKDYLAQILATAGPTVATTGNHNNELGVPLTVLGVTAATRYLVVEMGARGVGHVAYLCTIAPPRIGAVLNVGSAHVGEFGSRELIAQAKGELIEALPSEGLAVLNADDELVAAMAERTAAPVLTFGESGTVAWRGVELDDLGCVVGELGYDGTWAPVHLRLPGRHQIANAAAAAAMAIGAGVSLATSAAALSAAEPVSRWRMEVRQRPDGLLVVNDAYNANPDSMAAALDTVAEIGRRTGRRTVAVLGVMRELGAESESGHRAVGAVAATHGIQVLVTVGPEAELIGDGAEEQPSWTGLLVRSAGRDEAERWLRHNVTAGDVVLVKASRAAALELLADALLTDDWDGGTPAP